MKLHQSVNADCPEAVSFFASPTDCIDGVRSTALTLSIGLFANAYTLAAAFFRSNGRWGPGSRHILCLPVFRVDAANLSGRYCSIRQEECRSNATYCLRRRSGATPWTKSRLEAQRPVIWGGRNFDITAKLSSGDAGGSTLTGPRLHWNLKHECILAQCFDTLGNLVVRVVSISDLGEAYSGCNI